MREFSWAIILTRGNNHRIRRASSGEVLGIIVTGRKTGWGHLFLLRDIVQEEVTPQMSRMVAWHVAGKASAQCVGGLQLVGERGSGRDLKGYAVQSLQQMLIIKRVPAFCSCRNKGIGGRSKANCPGCARGGRI